MPKISEGYADKIEVPAGKRDVLVFDNGHDDAVRGFGIRKYADGSASYIVKYAVNGEPRRHTLGPVRKGNLKKMRSLAEEVKARARIGEDVIGEKKAAAAEKKAAESAATVGALIKVFLAEREEATRKIKNGKPVTPTLRVKTHEQTTRYLNTHCASLHGLVVGTVTRGAEVGVVDIDKRWTPINGHKLEIVTRSHVVGVIDEVAKTRGRVSADRCKAAISTFYVWCIDQGYCEVNPTMNIKARSTNGARERTLSDQELAEVWHACRDDDYGRIVRLLILTGQRRVEIGDLSRPEVGLGERLLKIPAERIKTNRSHIVWLADQALAIVKGIPASERDLLFGRGAGGYGGWTESKTSLDKRINAARAKAGLPAMPHWTLHDLRRSFSTRCNELGLGLPHVIEACLNHVIGGVHGVYNRAQFETAKAEVWERWGAHIAQLVSRPQPAKAAKPKGTASAGASVTAAGAQ